MYYVPNSLVDLSRKRILRAQIMLTLTHGQVPTAVVADIAGLKMRLVIKVAVAALDAGMPVVASRRPFQRDRLVVWAAETGPSQRSALKMLMSASGTIGKRKMCNPYPRTFLLPMYPTAQRRQVTCSLERNL